MDCGTLSDKKRPDKNNDFETLQISPLLIIVPPGQVCQR
jgi:hypothetical protein